jgi:hypothetical protein
MQTNGTPRRSGPFVPGSLLEFLMEFVPAFFPGRVDDGPNHAAAPAAPQPAQPEPQPEPAQPAPAPPAPGRRAARHVRALRW